MTDLPLEQTVVHGLLLFSLGCAIVPLCAALVRHLAPERVVFFARWGFSHVALVVLGSLALSLVVGWVFGAPAESDAAATPDVVELLGLNAAFFAAICGLIFYFAHRLHPESWRALGMQPRGHARGLLAALATYVMLLPLLLGGGLIWQWLWPKLGGANEPQEIAQLLAALPKERLLVAAIFAVGLQPLLEEIIFRGFLQPLFVQNFGAIGGIGATSFLFAAVHGGSAFLPIFLLSTMIGAVMLRTQRLTAAWLLHALNNGTMLALMAWSPDSLDLLQ